MNRIYNYAALSSTSCIKCCTMHPSVCLSVTVLLFPSLSFLC